MWHFRMFSTAQKSPFHVVAMWQLFKQQRPLGLHLLLFHSSHFMRYPVFYFIYLFFFQLAQAWQEVEVAKSRAQQLQDQVEDLQEKVSVQVAGSHGDVSLLSELETSLEAADLGVSKEEVSRSLLRVFLTPDREQI